MDIFELTIAEFGYFGLFGSLITNLHYEDYLVIGSGLMTQDPSLQRLHISRLSKNGSINIMDMGFCYSIQSIIINV